MTGTIALYPSQRPVIDNYGHVIVFKDVSHAQWCLARMGHDVGGFTFARLVGVSGGYTRAYNKYVRDKRRRESNG